VLRKNSKNICFLLIIFTTLVGCGKQLAPNVVPALPGQSRFSVEINEKQRALQAYLHKRKTERLTREAKAESGKRMQREGKVNSSIAREHLKMQHPNVQKHMQESQKEAEKNRPFRNLRQRLRLWRYK